MMFMRLLFRSFRRLLLLGISVLVVSTVYISVWHSKALFLHSLPTLNPIDAGILQELSNQSGQACVHPKLQLWHPALSPYFKDVPPLTCGQVEENWVYSENGTFKVSKEAKAKHGKVLCEFRPLIRGGDDFAVMNGDPIKPIKDGDPMPADYGEVKCIGSTGKVYKNFVLGIAPIPSFKTSTKTLPEGATGMNILMFGFDSTSRMTWMRNLPKTHEYFTKVLKGTVMEGYNIVGDGTPQALLPILTGFTEPELPEARRGYQDADNVDNHPWIWKQLNEAGYVTQWGEDGASAGTFTYRMLGFKDQPVDHYLRPFYIRAEQQYGYNQPFCLGSLPRHVNMLNWVKNMYSSYPNTPKFSFVFHSEFTHGGYSQVRVVDKDLEKMLRDLNEGGYLDNTLLILMSDHGARFQQVRQTVQGKYEERMPYFSFRFPTKFQQEHKEAIQNLKLNAHRLTTPFDVHATFEHLLDFTGDLKGDLKDRGISVLKEIPVERSCDDAGIEPHWCVCLRWQNINTSFPSILKAANALLDIINNATENERSQCQTLRLFNISSAVVYSPNNNVLKFKGSRDIHGRVADFSDDMQVMDMLYQITVEVSPGGGKFEATIKYLVHENKYIANLKEISRINKYGNHPHCVQQRFPHLRPYCYCHTQLQ